VASSLVEHWLFGPSVIAGPVSTAASCLIARAARNAALLQQLLWRLSELWRLISELWWLISEYVGRRRLLRAAIPLIRPGESDLSGKRRTAAFVSVTPDRTCEERPWGQLSITPRTKKTNARYSRSSDLHPSLAAGTHGCPPSLLGLRSHRYRLW
jgi:hypothetical protein